MSDAPKYPPGEFYPPNCLLRPLDETDLHKDWPWPQICPACEGEPRRIMQVGESLPFAVIISMIGRHDEAHVYCKTCDGKGTVVS